jgi:hypothetical protein
VKSDQDSICEVFAKFYETLYEADADCRDYVEDDLVGLVLRVSPEEVDSALKDMKNKRAGAQDGIVAEMLKTGHMGLYGSNRRLF